MSSTIYNKAFDVELSHDFYETTNKFRINRDLEIVPVNACAKLMSNGRMRFVRTGSGFTVFYKSYLDSSTMTPVEKPLVELSGELEFLFVVRMNPDFAPFNLNITDLDVNSQVYSSGKILLLDKSVSSYPAPGTPPAPPPPYIENLDDSLLDQLRPAVFTYSFLPDSTGLTSLDVTVFSENDNVNPVLTINGIPVDPSTGIFSVEIDLDKQSKGIYTIFAKDGATTENTATIYVDSDLARENIFGLIRLKFADAGLLYETCTSKDKFFTFNYAFINREIQWRYYITIGTIPSNFFDTRYLEIIDDNTPDPPVYTFTGLDGGVPSSSITINGSKTVIITSVEDIPFTETAIKRFVLRQVNAPMVYKTLMTSLANAASTGVDSNQVGASGEQYAEIFLFLDQVSP